MLATPIKTWELLTGKILAALLPSMALTWLAGVVFAAAAKAFALSEQVFAAIANPGWLTVLFVCAPFLALIALVAAIMLAVIARFAVWGATLLFQREVILTRWT